MQSKAFYSSVILLLAASTLSCCISKICVFENSQYVHAQFSRISIFEPTWNTLYAVAVFGLSMIFCSNLPLHILPTYIRDIFLTAQTTQKIEFVLLNVTYRLTVYRTVKD